VAKETKPLKVKVKITLRLPPEGTIAEAERRYLHRVLQNLAGNATRYANSEICLSAGIYDSCAVYCGRR
jgi:two-component system sensor histidine kinase RstB